MSNRSPALPHEDFLNQAIHRYLAVVRLDHPEEFPLTLDIKQVVRTVERALIRSVMDEAIGRGQYEKTAQRLGIHRNSLRLKMKELRIYVRRRRTPLSNLSEAVLG